MSAETVPNGPSSPEEDHKGGEDVFDMGDAFTMDVDALSRDKSQDHEDEDEDGDVENGPSPGSPSSEVMSPVSLEDEDTGDIEWPAVPSSADADDASGTKANSVSKPPPAEVAVEAVAMSGVSLEEFEQLQMQLMTLKTEKYETIDRERMLQNELMQVKRNFDVVRTELNRAQRVINTSKVRQDVAAAFKENEGLKRMIKHNELEFQAQQSALRSSMLELNSKNEMLLESNNDYKSKESEWEQERRELLAEFAQGDGGSSAAVDDAALREKLSAVLGEESTLLEAAVSAVKESAASVSAENGTSTGIKNAATAEATRQLRRQLDESIAKVHAMEADVAKAVKEVEQASSDREIIIMKLAEKDLTIDQLKDSVKRAESKARNAEETARQQAQNDSGADQLNERVRSMEEAVELKTNQLKSLRTNLLSVRSELVDKETALEESIEESVRQQRQLQDLKSTLGAMAEDKDKAETGKKAAYLENDKLQARQRNEMDSLKMQHEEQVDGLETELKTTREELATASADLEEKTAKVEELSAVNEVLQEKVDAGEAGMSEMRTEVDRLTKELETAKTELETTVAEHTEAFEEKSKENESLSSRMEKLEEHLTDAKRNIKIAEKKAQQQTKELIKQLQKLKAGGSGGGSGIASPRSSEMQRQQSAPAISRGSPRAQGRAQDGSQQLSQSSSMIPSSLADARGDGGTRGRGGSGIRGRGRGGSGIGGRGGRGGSAPQSVELLEEDNKVLAMKLGELQTVKWQLEEKIRFLHENIVLLNDDLERKSTIIKHYVVKRMRTGRAAPDMEGNRNAKQRTEGIMAQLYRSAAEQKEQLSARGINIDEHIAGKMNAVLEETLLKNMQLQTDITTIGDEVTKLEEENKALKARVHLLQD